MCKNNDPTVRKNMSNYWDTTSSQFMAFYIGRILYYNTILTSNSSKTSPTWTDWL